MHLKSHFLFPIISYLLKFALTAVEISNLVLTFTLYFHTIVSIIYHFNFHTSFPGQISTIKVYFYVLF